MLKLRFEWRWSIIRTNLSWITVFSLGIYQKIAKPRTKLLTLKMNFRNDGEDYCKFEENRYHFTKECMKMKWCYWTLLSGRKIFKRDDIPFWSKIEEILQRLQVFLDFDKNSWKIDFSHFCRNISKFLKIIPKFFYERKLHCNPVAYAGGLGVVQHPPPTGKNCCRKMMLFPKALFLATTFPKNR